MNMECQNCHHPVHLHRVNGDCTECATRCSHAAGVLELERRRADPNRGHTITVLGDLAPGDMRRYREQGKSLQEQLEDRARRLR